MQKFLKMAELLKRQVLKKSECFQIAETVHCNEDSCLAALEFFTDLNQVFYYPDILPDVVFVDPMVLIDKITELVICSYELHHGLQSGTQVMATIGERKKFRDFGKVSEEFLQSFRAHYHSDIFTAKELIKLFRALLVFGDVSEKEWFMPCLLTSLCKACLEEQCSSGRQAMAIHFSTCGPQNGMFCSLISYLSSDANTHPKQWKIIDCLHINCAKFTIPGSKETGEITVIDRFSHFEVHLQGSPQLERLPHDRGS